MIFPPHYGHFFLTKVCICFLALNGLAQAPTSCDSFAADPLDENRVTVGVSWEELNLGAPTSCEVSLREYPNNLRFKYQLARSHLKTGRMDRAIPTAKELYNEGHVMGTLLFGASFFYKSNEDDYKRGKAIIDSVADIGHEVGEIYMAYLYEVGQARFRGDGDEGIDQDYKRAIELYQSAVNKGNAIAQYRLGILYYKGKGVERDIPHAVKLFSAAADQDYSPALVSLGYMYDNGIGVTQSDKKTVELYKKAADMGDAVAQYNLGIHYRSGKGVIKNERRATGMFAASAEKYYPRGIMMYGYALLHGRGVAINEQEAYYKFLTASNLGVGEATLVMATLKAKGRGTERDLSGANMALLTIKSKNPEVLKTAKEMRRRLPATYGRERNIGPQEAFFGLLILAVLAGGGSGGNVDYDGQTSMDDYYNGLWHKTSIDALSSVGSY